MSERRRSPRRTARAGLPIPGALTPKQPVTPITRRRGPLVVTAALVVALTGFLAVQRTVDSGYFRVQQVTVQGAGALSEPTLIAAADVIGRQFWQVQTATAAERVAALPGVKTARVQRALPNSVTLTVEGRLPAVVWQIGRADYVVDDEGYVLDGAPINGLPAVMQVDGPAALSPGERVDPDAVQLAMKLGALVPAETGQRVTRFEYSSAAGFDVVLDRGPRVRLGDGADLAYKMEMWRGILAQTKQEKLRPNELDLRFGRFAAVR